MDEMDGKDLFLLWWLFFDEEHTRHLRVLISHPAYRKFDHELIGFLANHLVKSVTRCTLRYNWIIKTDYMIALSQNMPDLRHLIFYHDPPTDDLLKLLAQSCQNLWKLEFIRKVDSDLLENHEPNKSVAVGTFGAKRKLTSKGYQIFFEKQNNLREIDLSQVEQDLSTITPVERAITPAVETTERERSASFIDDSFTTIKPVLDPLKQMQHLRKLVVSHNYIEIIEILPQIEQLELTLTPGIHYLETVSFLRDKPFKYNPNTSAISDDSMHVDESRLVPLDDLLFSDMNKLEKSSLQLKFPGIKRLTLELRVFAAAKDYPESQKDNPSLLSLGTLNSEYASSAVKNILKDFQAALTVRFSLYPVALKMRDSTFLPHYPIFKSFDALLMESLRAFSDAETIILTTGTTETLFQFRICYMSLRNDRVNERDPYNEEDYWGGWTFGLKVYMRKYGSMFEGHQFTKAIFPNLTVLELNFGEAKAPYIHSRIGSKNPPISHDLFCQLFFLSDNLRKLKLNIPGGIAKFSEKEFLSRCRTVYGRKKISKLCHVSLWFSNVSINRLQDQPDMRESETTILSVIGFLQLLSICSKQKSFEDMLWLNLTGDNEKRFLREHETHGIYLPCVTHLLNRYIPMVAFFENPVGSIRSRWVCSDLRRAASLYDNPVPNFNL